ncbi:MAG: protein kinase [Acidobacteriota bacterium]
MELERWRRTDNILQAALALNPAERSVFVDSACEGDESLRDEVISLLSLEKEGLDIIDRPALEAAACVLAPDQPDLIEGQFVGHFRILSLLGAGGMGEVYLAEDTKLGRKIALKLLPADFSTDRGRVRRFQQEARAASALNHPYIVTIHETGEFQDRHFIATEYIEGETLRQRMRRTTLNLNETLDIAIQVAGALGAAHQAGIVHRDVKPENIMLRPDGYVKVLDFGLATLEEQSGDGGSSDFSSKEGDTTPGLLIGTVKYMSPEQARGLNLDARSDLFSLGIVIYEMLAGRPPFEGETNSDLIAAILRVEPVPLTQSPAVVPAELQDIVSKALCKDRDQRYQTINDLLAELERLREGLELAAKLPRSSYYRPNTGSWRARLYTRRDQSASNVREKALRTALSPAHLLSRSNRRGRAAVMTAVAVILLGSVAWLVAQQRSRSSERRFQSMEIINLTTNGKARDAAISPDGKLVAYVVEEAGQEGLWIRQVATNSTAPITPPEPTRYQALTFSRDGNSVYYVKYEGFDLAQNALYQVSVFGGASRKLIPNVHSAISFSPNGEQVAFIRRYPRETVLIVANADGAGEQELTKWREPEFLSTYPCGPAWSPDGRVIACGAGYFDAAAGRNLTRIVEFRLEDKTDRPITSKAWRAFYGLGWLSDGSGLILAALDGPGSEDTAKIWRISYPSGEAEKTTSELNTYTGISLTSDSLNLVTTQSSQTSSMWIGPTGDLSQARQITSSRPPYRGLALTPDGKIVCGDTINGNLEILTMELDGTDQKQLTFAAGKNHTPSVSLDGQYIAFASTRGGEPGLWRMDINGDNPTLLTRCGNITSTSFSPDGKWIVYSGFVTGHAIQNIWKVSSDGGSPSQLTDKFSAAPTVSPDGKMIACVYRDAPSSAAHIAIIPFEGGQPIKTYLAPGLSYGSIRWAPDGSALTYIETHGGISNLWSQPLAGGLPSQLTHLRTETMLQAEWSRDGKQLAFVRNARISDVVLIRDGP